MMFTGFLYVFLLLVLRWSVNGVEAAAVSERESLPPCSLGSADGLFSVTTGCTWSQVQASSTANIHVAGSADTPSIVAAADPATSGVHDAASAGMRLHLERLVLVGFAYAGPGQRAPMLWPQGLVDQDGGLLNLTDVRLVTSSQEVFNTWLHFFTNDSRVVYWTDNTTFLHIHQWTDSRTQLLSVGLLVQAPPQTPNPAELLEPLVKNCIVSATNLTLVPALLTTAAVVTPQPLLVYVTANVSIGANPKLPALGIPINRPVVFVGLQSMVTSIDFEMVVNQLNETGSKYSNVTFVGLVLENIAPGDSATSAVAAPFSIAISNNVWAVYYNRTTPNDIRLALFNTTMVLPQESEMAYVTYMFTLYTSPLPYLRQQTTFYSDVLHLSILQFSPGPGSRAITVNRLKSWYHWWSSVVLTTDPIVAKPLPLPPRQLALATSTRVSPLVQAVHTADTLKSSAESRALGDREHILLLLANISLAPVSSSSGSSSILLKSAMSWIGSSPADQAAETWPELKKGAPASPSTTVFLAFGYQQAAVVIPDGSAVGALHLQQLVLWQLPQGPGVSEAVTRGDTIPKELWTMLLWCIQRPLKDKTLNLDGVVLQLPGPELEYIHAAGKQSSDFVIELSGVDGKALTFQDVSLVHNGVHVGAFQGPGMVATNLTLRLDPDAVTAMPGGYVWPDPSQLPQPVIRGLLAPWMIAVIVVCVTLAAAAALLAGVVCWRRKQLTWSRPDSKCSLLDSQSLRGKQHDDGSVACSYAGQLGNSSAPAGIGCGSVSHSHSRSQGQSSDPGGVKCHVPCELCLAVGDNAGKGDLDSESDVTLPKSGTPITQLELAELGHKPHSGTMPAGKKLLQQQQQQRQQQPQQSGQGVTGQQLCSEYQDVDVSGLRDAPVPVHVADSLADSVAAGMQRWRAAVSSTTMLLMERRMDAANLPATTTTGSSGSWPGSGASNSRPHDNDGCIPEDGMAEPLESAAGQQFARSAPSAPPQQQQQQQGGLGMSGSTPPQLQLQLMEMLGQGSCGCVYLATWRGKRVAVKVMHLPANALLGPQSTALCEAEQQQGDEDAGSMQRRRRARQLRQTSAPHMAIIETVVSSTMSHPNVVQVYTYMLNPLTSSSMGQAGGAYQSAAAASAGSTSQQDISGWELKLVMEYCNEGSLRDALDCGLLAKPGSFLAPSAVLTLAHDVAAAMLHLHSEGIVHGDLKAGNVMLTASGNDSNSMGGGRVWAAGGGRCLTAKVADFGLAMPLGPSDTHATLCARGTPTHMSPELFMAGHVSKASDVYAYGILLYEIITGKRAYAGVPIPLLPHEVARQGLRPTWPNNLPPGCRDLRRLAEACWAQLPQDRPTFGDILRTLDLWASGCHGWPLPAPAGTSSTATKPQQQQQQQAADAAAGAIANSGQGQGQGDDNPQQQQDDAAQQQQQQQQLNSAPALSPASPAAAAAAAGALPAQQPALPSDQQQQSTGQQPAAAMFSPSAIRQQSTGRNMHMDWSEVDCSGV